MILLNLTQILRSFDLGFAKNGAFWQYVALSAPPWSAIAMKLQVLAIAPLFAFVVHASALERLQFNRDIRPILTENCYACHGPDSNHRKADLRLDVREGALQDGAIVAGKPEASEVIARLFTADADELMPPPDSHKKLSSEEKAILQRWVKEGAEYQGHWAFEKPQRPVVPELDRPKAELRNPVDAFVLARLAPEGMGLSPQAAAHTLVRRVTLDLTGLPPTPEVVAAFVADPSDAAYEGLVDRLLQSPAYGEQMAAQWLDYARYADSHGFQTDSSRSMWPWRDWVIGAFNRNQAFDQFTIEQLAGDLLPEAQLDQVVATGFHRNHRINGEGGIIDEEWRIENIIDRVDTTGATWMGLTLGCARCHDHKYDPISQKEFFELFAFFNNVEETGVIRGASNRTGGNPGPSIKVPNAEQTARMSALRAAVEKAEVAVKAEEKKLPELVTAWEPGFREELEQNKPIWQPLMPDLVSATHGTSFARQEDGSYLAGGPVPDKETYLIEAPISAGLFSAILLETFPDPTLPNQSVGRFDNGNFVLTRVEAQIHAPSLAKPLNVTFVEAEAEYSQKGWGIESLIAEANARLAKRKKAVASNRGKGWAVDGPSRREPNRAMLVAAEAVSVPADARLSIRLVHETLSKHQIGRFRLSYAAAAADRVTLAGDGVAPAEVQAVLAMPIEQRNAAQRAKLAAFFRTGFDSSLKRADQALAAARKQYDDFEMALPSTMVMKELPEPRAAHLLIRGEYANPGEQVTAATPAVLPPLPAGAARNRLTLARWLVSPEHPLTARVWVNRQWERLFGRGLVKSSENLGVQSDPPSHPELLDWLATEFVGKGWDMKALIKTLVMSATYRQSSELRHLPAGWVEKDVENRLLARGPRLRLPAEAIRDQALFVSGLLAGKVGGPSVRPYMPMGVWDETSRYGDLRGYKHEVQGGLFRRTIYTIWKRTAAPPTMLLFDSPSREMCTVKRARTNTPLQALALMNEVTYVEAARHLAQRMILEGGATPEQRLGWAFQQVLCRAPTEQERAVLAEGLGRHRQRFEAAGEEAKKLIQTGETPVPVGLGVAELAAYTVTANVLLNLDEWLNKE
jgi:mono/diheme cytochrome c family protein